MEIVGHDPFVSPGIAKDGGIRLVSLDELYGASDYVSLHVGLTPQTENMINAESLKKMKKGVRLVNCARGELVDEAALIGALERWPSWRSRSGCFRQRAFERIAPAKNGQCDPDSAHRRLDQ